MSLHRRQHRIIVVAFAGLALQGASVLAAETAPSVTTVSAASRRAGDYREEPRAAEPPPAFLRSPSTAPREPLPRRGPPEPLPPPWVDPDAPETPPAAPRD